MGKLGMTIETCGSIYHQENSKTILWNCQIAFLYGRQNEKW